MSEKRVEEMLAKQSIRDVLSRYCRGLDRMDKAMAYSVWHPDGTAHYYDMFKGTGRGFIDWVWQTHGELERHSHQVANIVADIDGAKAVSEAYVTVCLWTRPDAGGSQFEVVSRGRYLDRWSCRDGRWAIDHRIHVQDMQTMRELGMAQTSAHATRDCSDASYEIFPKPVSP